MISPNVLENTESDNLAFSIVIPVYNEEDGIAPTLTHLQETLKTANCPYSYEILVVNDGSRDKTGEILQSFAGIRLIEHRRNQGYGAALKTGIRHAKYPLIVITDGDGTFNQLLWNYDRIITATPRAFGAFLLLATLYYFFKENRWLFLGMIFLLGGFYQVLLLPLGGVLFLQLFRWKNGLPRGLTTNKKTLWLSLSGLGLILGILIYYALLPSPYGPTITKSQALAMEEFQPGGRVQFFYFNPNIFFDPQVFWLNNSRSGFTPDRILKPEILSLSFLLPLLISYSSYFPLVKLLHRKATIILQLIIVSFSLFILAHLTLFTLYLPNRYTLPLQYATRLITPMVLVILMSAVLKQLEKGLISQQNHSKPSSVSLSLASTLAIILTASVILFPGLFLKLKHYMIEGTEPQLYQFFSQKPKDTIIASLAYEASNLPSFTQRSVLVSREFSHPYELGYYNQFRKRTLDLIKAQYTPNLSEVKMFINQYKISYFLLEKEVFKPQYISESLAQQDWLKPFTKTGTRNDPNIIKNSEKMHRI